MAMLRAGCAVALPLPKPHRRRWQASTRRVTAAGLAAVQGDLVVASAIVAGGTGQRPFGLALVRGITRGTDGAVGRLTCGI
jgi:hypothetical protein